MTTICEWRGCDPPATHVPELLVWARRGDVGRPERAARMMLQIALCREHLSALAADDILDAEAWHDIARSFRTRGFPPPDRRTAVLRPVALAAAEVVFAKVKSMGERWRH